MQCKLITYYPHFHNTTKLKLSLLTLMFYGYTQSNHKFKYLMICKFYITLLLEIFRYPGKYELLLNDKIGTHKINEYRVFICHRN